MHPTKMNIHNLKTYTTNTAERSEIIGIALYWI